VPHAPPRRRAVAPDPVPDHPSVPPPRRRLPPQAGGGTPWTAAERRPRSVGRCGRASRPKWWSTGRPAAHGARRIAAVGRAGSGTRGSWPKGHTREAPPTARVQPHHRRATLLHTRFVAKPHHPVADLASPRRCGPKGRGVGCNHRSTSGSRSVKQPSTRARTAGVRD